MHRTRSSHTRKKQLICWEQNNSLWVTLALCAFEGHVCIFAALVKIRQVNQERNLFISGLCYQWRNNWRVFEWLMIFTLHAAWVSLPTRQYIFSTHSLTHSLVLVGFPFTCPQIESPKKIWVSGNGCTTLDVMWFNDVIPENQKTVTDISIGGRVSIKPNCSGFGAIFTIAGFSSNWNFSFKSNWKKVFYYCFR